MKSLCVYCGAAGGNNPEYLRAARELGCLMGERGIGLVYGGGGIGMMGAVADGCLEAGGRVTGVITQQLVDRELAHPRVADMRVVETMHERKKAMADLARGFIALPGGVGTLDELFEVMAWSQLAIHDHPIGLLNTEGYFNKIVEFLDHAAAEEFLRTDPREMLVIEAQPERLLDRMAAYSPPKRRSVQIRYES